MTRGKLIASHIKVRLLGVCDQPVNVADVDARVLVGVPGGDAVSLAGDFALLSEDLPFAVDVRVARLVGEGCAGASSVDVLFRVVTIFSPSLDVCSYMLCMYVLLEHLTWLSQTAALY